jgi:hypothetical protein
MKFTGDGYLLVAAEVDGAAATADGRRSRPSFLWCHLDNKDRTFRGFICLSFTYFTLSGL